MTKALPSPFPFPFPFPLASPFLSLSLTYFNLNSNETLLVPKRGNFFQHLLLVHFSEIRKISHHEKSKVQRRATILFHRFTGCLASRLSLWLSSSCLSEACARLHIGCDATGIFSFITYYQLISTMILLLATLATACACDACGRLRRFSFL